MTPKILKSQNPQGWEVEIPKKIREFSSERSKKNPSGKHKDPKISQKIPPTPLWRLFPGREFREHSNNFGINGKNEFLEFPRAQPHGIPADILGFFPLNPGQNRQNSRIIPKNPSLGGEKKPKSQILGEFSKGNGHEGDFSPPSSQG